ncbi:MAG: Mammalian cell entry related domain protein [Mycobacterium sp.]|uniref:Mammalian cell entry related domain protein n=1 Tax=Mycobacterium sp. TaxID=1785 RepID=UPI003C3B4892
MLLNTAAETEARTLTVVGAAVVLVCTAVAGMLIVVNPFGGRPKGDISIAIDTPYIGQGVATGTALVMHGVTVGKVRGLSSLPGGGVRLDADLQTRPTAGLTDTMEIDFRPINYFGVTGINLKAGRGGHPLYDGMRIDTMPKGNFALQALLTRLGEITTGVVTPQLIHVIDWGTRYTDALNPLIETMLSAANAVAKVQTVSTKRLLINTTGLSVAFPTFVKSLIDAGDGFIQPVDYINWTLKDATQKEYEDLFLPTVIEAETGLFGAVGRLLSTHSRDLHPVTEIVKALFDVVAPLIRPEQMGQMVAELRTRFEKMYGGTPEQRALRVRLVLDSLPGVAAPIAAVGGTR